MARNRPVFGLTLLWRGCDRDREGADPSRLHALTGEEEGSARDLKARDGHRFKSLQLKLGGIPGLAWSSTFVAAR